MADARLRALDRAAAAGDGAARARGLSERVRQGRLRPERLALAAWLDDPAARRCAGPPEREPPRDLGALGAGLEALFGPDALARAALIGARQALAVWEAWEAGEFAPRERVRAALERCERDPPEAARRALDEAVVAVGHAARLLGSLRAGREALAGAWRHVDAGAAAIEAGRVALAVHAREPGATRRVVPVLDTCLAGQPAGLATLIEALRAWALAEEPAPPA